MGEVVAFPPPDGSGRAFAESLDYLAAAAKMRRAALACVYAGDFTAALDLATAIGELPYPPKATPDTCRALLWTANDHVMAIFGAVLAEHMAQHTRRRR